MTHENSTPAHDLALVMRCRTGAAAAWQSLYLAHFDFIFRVAQRLGLSAHDAEEVAQEVFTVAFRKLDHFQTGDIAPWLYRICANLVSLHHRKRRVREAFRNWFSRSSPEDEADVARGPDGHLESQQARDQLAQVLSRMSPKKREVFALFELERMSGDEIAKHLQCPVDTVWTRLRRAREEFTRIANRLGVLES